MNPINAPFALPQNTGKLTAPTGPIPGAGLLRSIGSLFSAPSRSIVPQGSSSLPSFSAPTLPGFMGSMQGSMPSFSTAGGGNAPTLSAPTIVPPPAPRTQASTSQTPSVGTAYPVGANGQPNYAGFSDQDWLNYQGQKTLNVPSFSPTGQAGLNVGSMAPQNFSVPNNGSTYTSDFLNPNSIQGLMSSLQELTTAMNTGKYQDGTDASGLFPTDSLQGNIANQLYQSRLYSPEEQSLISMGQDLTAQVNSKKLAERRKISQLLEDGSITREQATAFATETERRSNQELADLSVQQDSVTARLNALGLLRQNQVGALQGALTSLSGQEVAPGSSVFNPITGVQYQGGGASPSTIQSTAQSLKQNDQMTGNLQMNADGTVNDAYYFAQAQQMYSGGGYGSGAMGGANGGGQTGALPSQVQTYLNASGGQYINEDRVPAGQRDIVRDLAAKNGVPFLSAGDVASVQGIDYTKAAMGKLTTIVDQILGDGVSGKLGNIAKAAINNFFPTSEARTAFNAARETAIKQIQAIGSGTGSGFRLNQQEIDNAVSQMPLQTDTLSVAKAKIAWLNSFLDTKRSLALTGTIGPQTAAPGLNSTGGSNLIQTSAGAVDNSWFQ